MKTARNAFTKSHGPIGGELSVAPTLDSEVSSLQRIAILAMVTGGFQPSHM